MGCFVFLNNHLSYAYENTSTVYKLPFTKILAIPFVSTLKKLA